ncbi:MAG TPA: hypothetical protein VNR60_04860 [Croceibacterium sp.]|nr:hypothetical protein [Croceibacterium sp.]
MLEGMSDNKPWFRPKSYGYGAGLPIAWQGWVLLLSYMAAIIGLAVLAPYMHGAELIGLIALMVFLTAILVVIAKARTKGGWRWRNGD